MPDLAELLAEKARRQLAALQAEKARRAQTTMPMAIAQGAAERLVEAPMQTAEFGARAVRGGGNVIRGLLDQIPENVRHGAGVALLGDTGPGHALGDEFAGVAPIPIPEGGLLGLPSGREAIAGVQSLLSGGSQEQAVAGRDQIQEDRPFSHMGGGLLADAGMIMSGRAPFMRGTKAAKTPMKSISGRIDDAEEAVQLATRNGDVAGSAFAQNQLSALRMQMADATTDIIGPKVAPLLREMKINKSVSDYLSKLAGRSLESVVEGTALAIMHGDDPIQSGVSAGAGTMMGMVASDISNQAGFADLLRGRLVAGGAKIGMTAFALGSIGQLFKETMPGGNDFLMDSFEAGFAKIPIVLAMHIAAQATGSNRVGGGSVPVFDVNLPPLMMDALTTIPRTGFLTLMRQLNDDESGDIESMFNTIMTQPQAFSKAQLERLSTAIDEGTVPDAIRDMAENDEKFRQILEAPKGLEAVPVRK